MKKLFLSFLLIVLALTVVSCGKDDPAAAQEGNVTIKGSGSST